MKIVFPLVELTEAIEDAAALLFEEQGGTLGDGGLKLSGMNMDTQEYLFTITPEPLPEVVLVDMSPDISSDGYNAGADPDLDGANPDA